MSDVAAFCLVGALLGGLGSVALLIFQAVNTPDETPNDGADGDDNAGA